MGQQTAVEWLIEQMKNGNFESWHTKNKWNTSYHAQEKTLEIAKAMEKEQIKDAYWNGTMHISKEEALSDAEKFYNEYYKN